MERKYLTESARITDAYAEMYAKNENTQRISESAKVPSAYKGQLSIEGKGSAKTGSKLGKRDVLPFAKRDAKNNCGHAVPMKNTFGNGKVKTGPTDTRTIKHNVPSKTGSKLGERKVLPFAKRDEKPTSVGKINGVKNVGCVKGIKECTTNGIEQGKECGKYSEPVHNPNTKPINNLNKVCKGKKCSEATDEELQYFSNDNMNYDSYDFDGNTDDTQNADSVDDVSDDEDCCGKCTDAISLALTTFEEIYDRLSDDDKELVDSAKDELQKCIDGDDSEDDTEDDTENDTDTDSDDTDSDDTDTDDTETEDDVEECDVSDLKKN